MDAERHPAIEPIAFLLGTWRGRGRGDYPTIEAFEYLEEVTFGHVGKPFLTYAQKTRSPGGAPLHAETGYLRPVGADAAELVIAQPTGVTEIHTGTVGGSTVSLRAAHVGLTPTAKEVVSVSRTIAVEAEVLRYRLDMGAVGQPHQFHLEAELARVAPADSSS